VAELVWYVAYGSNLCRARLQRYLDLGPDPSPPRGDRPLTIGHPLFFAGASTVWTGGRAYVDHVATGPTTTLARAWLLTRPQWDDLHARESGPGHGGGTDPASLAEGQAQLVGGGRYDMVLGLGRHGGIPVVTFTGPDRLDPATCARPAPAYLEQITTGLHEAHGLAVADAVAYLLDRPGVADQWTDEELTAALRG